MNVNDVSIEHSVTFPCPSVSPDNPAYSKRDFPVLLLMRYDNHYLGAKAAVVSQAWQVKPSVEGKLWL